MVWDTETQRRFNSLRERQLSGELSAAEQHELDELLAVLDAEEASYLAPAIAHMDEELHRADAQLAALQIRNEELAALARQHEQLLSEAASWLEQFDQRRIVLQNRYARLAGEPLPTESGR
jgi:chromosome segregation ATPase